MVSKEFFELVAESRGATLAWCCVLLPFVHAAWILSAFITQSILAHRQGLVWKDGKRLRRLVRYCIRLGRVTFHSDFVFSCFAGLLSFP